MPSVELLIEDLPLDKPFAIASGGMKIVVVRTSNDIYAFEDVCPHAFWPLSVGTFQDGILECPGHAWEFQVDTGKCQRSPAYCLTPVARNILGKRVRLEWEVTQPKAENCPPLVR
jgi:nitrite reductase/ring-hydroxylating ferredoxin subunit